MQTSGVRYVDRLWRDVRTCVAMRTLALVCGAVGLFGLALKTDDKFWRTSLFVVAALNVVVLVLRSLE